MDAFQPRNLKRAQHQRLDLDVAFQSGMTVELCANLQRLAGAQQSERLRVQHRAAITQAGDALAVEQVRIDTRHLRRDVGAQTQQPSRQLIHQLEGPQVEIVAGARKQRIEILEHGRYNQLVAVREEQVEDAAAQPFHPRRFRGQDVLDVFRKQPLVHDRLQANYRGPGPLAVAGRFPMRPCRATSSGKAAAGRPASRTGRQTGSGRPTFR